MLGEHAELIEACRNRDLKSALDVMERHRGKAVDTLTNLVIDYGEEPADDAAEA